MKRAIKFRAYGPNCETMWDWEQVKSIANNLGWENFDEGERELMQFTGLKDENGVEVYEGDIVSIWHEDYPEDAMNGKVAWMDCYYPAFDVYYRSDRAKTGFESYSEEYNAFSCPDYRYKVIGNIHQNPELLEV